MKALHLISLSQFGQRLTQAPCPFNVLTNSDIKFRSSELFLFFLLRTDQWWLCRKRLSAVIAPWRDWYALNKQACAMCCVVNVHCGRQRVHHTSLNLQDLCAFCMSWSSWHREPDKSESPWMHSWCFWLEKWSKQPCEGRMDLNSWREKCSLHLLLLSVDQSL